MKKPKQLENEYHIFKLKLYFSEEKIYVVWKSMKDVLSYYEEWEVEYITTEENTAYISQWILDDCAKYIIKQ